MELKTFLISQAESNITELKNTVQEQAAEIGRKKEEIIKLSEEKEELKN